MTEEVLVVFTTWPDAATARSATHQIIGEKLAACGNLLPGVESIYIWQGKLDTTAEVQVIFKTNIGQYPRLEARIKTLHPYEIPEIIALRSTDGLPAYLRWVEASAAEEK